MQRGFSQLTVIALVIIFAVSAVTVYYFNANEFKQTNNVTDFQSCVEAGFEVTQLSDRYPRVCKTPDGKTFTEEEQKVCIQVITPAKNQQTGECKNFPTPCDVPEGWLPIDYCLNESSSSDGYELINETTSPNGMFKVTEKRAGDHQKITVWDDQNQMIVEDLVSKNYDKIGYGKKFGCQCGTSFKDWVNNDSFTIKIVNGNGEEYEYIIDAKTGAVDETSFKRIQ